MATLVCLTSLEELALRQLAGQSISIAPDLAGRLVRLAMAERYRDGWRLTPFGLRRYQALPKSPLQGRKTPPVIDNILNQAIPLARAAGIASADPLASLESMVTKQHALREHRALVRERQAARPSNGTIRVSPGPAAP
jgi:hypothetical protein